MNTEDRIKARIIAHRIAAGCIYKELYNPTGMSHELIPSDVDAETVYDNLQTIMQKLFDIAQSQEDALNGKLVITWGKPGEWDDDETEAG